MRSARLISQKSTATHGGNDDTLEHTARRIKNCDPYRKKSKNSRRRDLKRNAGKQVGHNLRAVTPSSRRNEKEGRTEHRDGNRQDTYRINAEPEIVKNGPPASPAVALEI